MSTIKDTKDLRRFLTEKMNAVANGEIDPKQTTAIANLAQQIYNTVNLELRSATVLNQLGKEALPAVKFDD